jgi:hypothetical protein
MKWTDMALAAALLVALAGASYGATYYVSTSGSDGWPGTQSQPWATLRGRHDCRGRYDSGHARHVCRLPDEDLGHGDSP